MLSFKHFSRRNGVRAVLCWCAAQYLRLVQATTRWQVAGADRPGDLWDRREPFILAFWHGRLLMMPCLWQRGITMKMLTSQHPDGELIARTIAYFGIGTVRGSSRRGGATALRMLVRELAAGNCVGVTPDGPRGPRMRARDGVIAVARLSGAAIVPAACATSHRRLLGTWDRFAVALPFGRGVLLWGAPIRVARDADDAAMAAARQQLEDTLNALSAEADRLTGHTPVEPAAKIADGALAGGEP